MAMMTVIGKMTISGLLWLGDQMFPFFYRHLPGCVVVVLR